MSPGAAGQKIPQLFLLGRAELRGAATAMALQQAFSALVIPRSNPSVNAGAGHVQVLGNWPRGLRLDAAQDGLQSQSYARPFGGLGFLAKRLKPLACS